MPVNTKHRRMAISKSDRSQSSESSTDNVTYARNKSGKPIRVGPLSENNPRFRDMPWHAATTPCKFFARNRCSRGSFCAFSHDNGNIKGHLLEVCKDFLHGRCDRAAHASSGARATRLQVPPSELRRHQTARRATRAVQRLPERPVRPQQLQVPPPERR